MMILMDLAAAGVASFVACLILHMLVTMTETEQEDER